MIFGWDLARAGADQTVVTRVEPQVEAVTAETSGTANPEPWMLDIGWGGNQQS